MLQVDLCGHATLASAHFLFCSGLVSGNKIEFLTRSGLLTASKVGLGKNNLKEEKFAVQLDFPAAALEDCDPSDFSSITAALIGATVTNMKKASTDDLLVLFPQTLFLLFICMCRCLSVRDVHVIVKFIFLWPRMVGIYFD